MTHLTTSPREMDSDLWYTPEPTGSETTLLYNK